MKPLAPMSLSRSAPVPQRDTPDPTSAPINKVLNAFQGNTNSSGTSTKAALDAIKDKSGPVVTSAAQDALEVFKEPSGSIVVPPASATDDKTENSSNEITKLFGGAAATAAGAGAPSPSAVPTLIGVAATPSRGNEVLAPTTAPLPTRTRAPSEAPPLPAPPEPSRSDATPAAVVTEASNSTSPGSKSFAEAPSSAGRNDDTEDAVRAALVQSRSFGVVAFLRTTRGMAIAGGAALLLVIVLVFAFKGDRSTSAKKAPVAAKKPDKTEVATAEKPATETPSTDESEEPGSSETEHAATNGGGSADESATPPITPTTNTPDTTETPATPDTTTPATAHPPTTHPPTTGTPKKAGPTIAGKQVVLEYDNQARDAKAAPKNNAAQADQGAIARARQSYAAGNQRLFAGDADGAIRNYKQALAYYPAYVAGYRGLGLAYAQQGNKPAALKALRTYLSSVPGAKDSDLVKKRIATLQAK